MNTLVRSFRVRDTSSCIPDVFQKYSSMLENYIEKNLVRKFQVCVMYAMAESAADSFCAQDFSMKEFTGMLVARKGEPRIGAMDILDPLIRQMKWTVTFLIYFSVSQTLSNSKA